MNTLLLTYALLFPGYIVQFLRQFKLQDHAGNLPQSAEPRALCLGGLMFSSCHSEILSKMCLWIYVTKAWQDSKYVQWVWNLSSCAILYPIPSFCPLGRGPCYSCASSLSASVIHCLKSTAASVFCRFLGKGSRKARAKPSSARCMTSLNTPWGWRSWCKTQMTAVKNFLLLIQILHGTLCKEWNFHRGCYLPWLKCSLWER